MRATKKRKFVRGSAAPQSSNVNAFESRHPNWRDKPWVVAIVSGAAVAVFFSTVILPISVKMHENEIAELAEQLQGANDEKSGLLATRAELEVIKKKLAEAESEVTRLRVEDPFKGGDPFPIGMRLVRLGQDASSIPSLYYNFGPEELESWTEIRSPSPLFDDVTFHKSVEGGREVVSRVSMGVIVMEQVPLTGDVSITSPKSNYDLIDKFLIEEFGLPDQVTRINGKISSKCWFDRRYVDIELDAIRMSLTSNKGFLRACGRIDRRS